MATAPSVKDQLHKIVGGLTLDEARGLLDFINNLNDPHELPPEEEARVAEARAEIARGEFITGEGLRRKYGLKLASLV
jgi:hypothetical protein